MQIQAILHAAAGFLAGDDVAQIGYGKDVLLNGSRLRLVEALDAVGGEDEIEVEGAVLELDEVFPTDDLGLRVFVEAEAESEEGGNHPPAVVLRAGWEEIDILSSAGKPKKNGAALADEEVIDAGGIKGLRDFLRLQGVERQTLVHLRRRLKAEVGRKMSGSPLPILGRAGENADAGFVQHRP